jgi:molybdenum cofactor biosynthesis enzyme MoaA
MVKVPEQIDIMVNRECNARCGFCIQEATFKPETASDEKFLAGVQKHVEDYVALDGRKVIITGGEPTLRPNRVEAILDILAPYSLDLVVMYTNGSQLLRQFRGKTIAQMLKEKGLDYVNHSVHHYDPAKNKAIFGIQNLLDASAIAKHLREIGLPLRYCATLQKGGLETADDILQYLAFASSNKAQDVYLRELFNVNKESASDIAPIEYSEARFVPAQSIIEGLAQKGIASVNQRTGFQGRNKNELEFRTKEGFPFFISTLEIGNERAEELPYLTIMPDGKLYSTWCGEKYRVQSLREAVSENLDDSISEHKSTERGG